jgi:hypothetical protein
MTLYSDIVLLGMHVYMNAYMYVRMYVCVYMYISLCVYLVWQDIFFASKGPETLSPFHLPFLIFLSLRQDLVRCPFR